MVARNALVYGLMPPARDIYRRATVPTQWPALGRSGDPAARFRHKSCTSWRHPRHGGPADQEWYSAIWARSPTIAQEIDRDLNGLRARVTLEAERFL
jgi:hypothetical protein